MHTKIILSTQSNYFAIYNLIPVALYTDSAVRGIAIQKPSWWKFGVVSRESLAIGTICTIDWF
jgi:hypothetical protein